MTIADFAGWAAAYVARAVAWAALLGGAATPLFLWCGWRRALPLLFATLFVIGLAMLPFPDRAGFDCALQKAHVIVAPFDGLGHALKYTILRGNMEAFFTNKIVTSTVMNVVFFMLPGAALAALTGRVRGALAYGLALSLGIELTQLSGNFGLYPCPYRFADVTDLITNTLGVVLGFALARHWRRRAAEG